MTYAILLIAALLAGSERSGPQGASQRSGLQPPSRTDAWPSFNGDFTGRRFSPLTRINDKNVKHLSLAWSYRVSGTSAAPIKSTPLQVNGILYFSSPEHVWAVDARTGREIWHFVWEGKGGNHIGNRGVGILNDWLYVETPDCHLVSLDIKDGKERWRQSICDLDRYYYASTAPIIIGNHVIVGVSGDDLDSPGYIEARDPATGALQWRWYTVPQKEGDPGLETWPSLEMAKHGGGMTWTPVTYDPELNLLYLTTGNPQPVVAHVNRPGANLFTGCIVAINPDDGKMRWYFQASPHDTHDWDATQTAVLIDGEINGRPRKLIAQASRNGKFFVLDRTIGKALISTDFVTTNWPSPTFSPATGLFYVSAAQAYSVWYIYDAGKNPMGWGGTDRGGWAQNMVQAIDYQTGKVRWSHKWEGGGLSGLLSTAGNLLFSGDGSSGNFVALNATTGDPLWRAGVRTAVSNGPITYTLDGLQYVVVGAGDTLWAFVMNE